MDDERQSPNQNDSEREADQLLFELMELVRLEIARPLEERIAALERRLATLEENQRP